MSRKSTKSPSRQVRQVAAADPKIKTSVNLSLRAFRRLSAAVAEEGMGQSEIVEMLINERLAGYKIKVEGKRLRDSPSHADDDEPVNTDDRTGAAGGVSADGAAAA